MTCRTVVWEQTGSNGAEVAQKGVASGVAPPFVPKVSFPLKEKKLGTNGRDALNRRLSSSVFVCSPERKGTHGNGRERMERTGEMG